MARQAMTNPLTVDLVLHPIGDSMHGAEVTAPRNCLLGVPGLFQGLLAAYSDVGVNLTVYLANAFQLTLNSFNGRDFLALN